MIPLSCTHEKLHPGSAAPRRLPRSLACYVPSLTAPRHTHAMNTPLSLFWQPSKLAMLELLTRIQHLCGSSSPMTRTGPGFSSRKISSFHLQNQSPHLGVSSSMMHNCLAKKKQTYRYAVVKPLLKHEPQVSHRIDPWQIKSFAVVL